MIGALQSRGARPGASRSREVSFPESKPLNAAASFGVFFAIFSLIWAKEFLEDGVPSAIYGQVAGEFRWVDLALLGLAWLAMTAQIATRRARLPRLPAGLKASGAAFLLAIGLSMVRGAGRGGANLFYDWRNLALGALFCIVVFNLLKDDLGQIKRVCLAFVGVVTVRALYLLIVFFLGGSPSDVFGQRTPVFDGTALTAAVGMAVTATVAGLVWRSGRMARYALLFGGAANVLLVILAFRRSFWADLAIASGLSMLLLKRGRVSLLLALTLLGVAGYLQLGSAAQERLRSMDPRQTVGRFTATNAFHVNDLLDAWDVVKKNPVWGIGLGTTYQTNRIGDYKTESTGVHNGPLQVWLKFGLLGLIAYFAFHVTLFRWLYRLVKKMPDNSFQRGWMIGTLAFFVAIQAVSLTFAPWPYGALAPNLVFATLLAVAWRLEQLPTGNGSTRQLLTGSPSPIALSASEAERVRTSG